MHIVPTGVFKITLRKLAMLEGAVFKCRLVKMATGKHAIAELLVVQGHSREVSP